MKSRSERKSYWKEVGMIDDADGMEWIVYSERTQHEVQDDTPYGHV